MPAHQKLREVSIPRSEGLEDPQVLPVSAAQGLRAMDAAPVIGLQKPPDLPVEEVQQFLVSGDLGDERVEAEKAGRSAEIRRRAGPRGDAPVLLGQGRAHANDILVGHGEGRLAAGKPFQHLADLVELADHPCRRLDDPHAAVGAALEKLALLEPAQGLPERRPADAVAPGEVRLGHARPGRQFTVDDGGADQPEQLLRDRRMPRLLVSGGHRIVYNSSHAGNDTYRSVAVNRLFGRAIGFIVDNAPEYD